MFSAKKSGEAIGMAATGQSIKRWLVDSNGVIPLELGGTGAKTASSALSNLGALGLSGGTLTNSLNIAGIAGNPYAFTVEGLSTIGSVWAHTVMVNGTPRFRAGVAGIGGRRCHESAGTLARNTPG